MSNRRPDQERLMTILTGHFRQRFEHDLSTNVDVSRLQEVESRLVFASDQDDAIRIPRSVEQLGAPVRLTEQSRAYLISLPLAGIRQVAQELRVAIDSGFPVKSVSFDVEVDEEGWDELVAKVDVDVSAHEALGVWENMERRLYRARQQLNDPDRAKLEQGFALYVEWRLEHDE